MKIEVEIAEKDEINKFKQFLRTYTVQDRF